MNSDISLPPDLTRMQFLNLEINDVPFQANGRRSVLMTSFYDLATFLGFRAGLPDFSWYNIPKRPKWHKHTKTTKMAQTYQMTIKCTKWQLNRPDGHKI
jgi:hypothetical protein